MGVDYIVGDVYGFTVSGHSSLTRRELYRILNQLKTLSFIEELNLFIFDRHDHTQCDRLSTWTSGQSYQWHPKTEVIEIDRSDTVSLNEIEREHMDQVITMGIASDRGEPHWYHISYISY
jgi:hypothetical protein